jgi:hypothetical protein
MCVGASTGSTCREEKQATEIACNTAPCDPHYWQTGAWTECSAACDGGEITRTVQCVSLNGQPAEDEVCGAIAKPATSQICNAQPCDFCANNNCSGHGSCIDGVCVCGEGFIGMHCQAPASCTSAIVDAAMICCASGTVNTKGECCPSGTALDASGGCCAPWAIDGCGVCGGEGKFVDMLGGCCATMLDSSGLCCASGKVDECGVCDGLGNTCTLDITMQIAVSKDALMGTAVLEEPLRDFLGEMAATLNVDPSGVDVYALELVDSTNTTPTSGGGRRLAQSSSSSLDTTDTSGRVRMDIAFKIPPESLKGETSSPSVSAAIASMAATQSPDSLVLIASSPTTSRMGVCGNRVCEIGEDSTACPSDCAFTGSSCTQGCSSGVCMPASGACECYPGYTGPDCSTCGSGYVSNVHGGCSADVFMMGTVEANSVITNPSVTDGSTGSGESTSTVVDESALAEQEGGNSDGVSASSVDGATSSTTTTDDDSSSGTNVGAIVGGLLGALAAVAVGLAVFVYIRRKRQNSDGSNGNSSTMMSSGENGDMESHGVIDVALRSKYGGDPTSSQYGGNNSNKSSKDFGAGGVMGGFQPTAGSARQYNPTAGGASSSARNQRLAQSTGDLPRDLAVMRASTSSLPAYINSVSTRYADCVDGEEDNMVMMMDEEMADIELNYDDDENENETAARMRMPPPPPRLGGQAPISARLTVAEIRGAVAALDKEEGEEHIGALRAAVDALETTSGRRSGRDGVVGSTEQQQQHESSDDTTTTRGSVSSMSSGGRRPAGVPLLDLNTLQSTKSKQKRSARAGGAALIKAYQADNQSVPAAGTDVTVAASNKEWVAKLSARGMGTPHSWRDDAGLQRTAAAGALHNSVEGALLPEGEIEGMHQQEAVVVQQLQHEPRESIVARYFNTPRGQLLRTLAAEATAALKGKSTMMNTTAADGVENVVLVGGGLEGRRSKSSHASPTKTLTQLAALSEKIQSAENSPAKGRKVLWR